MADYKSLCHLTILLLSLCFMLAQCSLEPADQFLDNPTDAKQEALTLHKRPSFFVGSRYGRSSGGSTSSGGAYAPSKTRRLNVVPRNDRFFLGSRYGKRAEFSTGTQLNNNPNPLYSANSWESNNGNNNNNVLPAPYYMSCVYTGLQNFYRCNSIFSSDKMFYVKNTKTLKNDYGYNYNVNGNGDNYDEDDDDAIGNTDADDVMVEDEEEELSTHATGASRINGFGSRNEDNDVKK